MVLISIICVPLGLLMFGFGVERVLSWAVLFVAYGFINVGLTGVANIGMTYVMDSYYPIAAEALLLVNGLKNIVAFGYTYGVIPWVDGMGYAIVRCCPYLPPLIFAIANILQTFGTMAGIYVAIVGLAMPLYIFGDRIRHWTSVNLRLISW
jgi:hypothetical protein